MQWIWQQGWLPSKVAGDYVFWVPRKFNRVADHPCHVAQDHMVSNIVVLVDLREYLGSSPGNLILTMDGGGYEGGPKGGMTSGWALWTCEQGHRGNTTIRFLWLRDTSFGSEGMEPSMQNFWQCTWASVS